jgi:hypothetical protein
MKNRRFRCLAIALFVLLFAGSGIAGLTAMEDAAGPIGITVGAQPVRDGRIVIKQVDSAGPAWLVIHLQNADGTMGAVIGYAAVCDGQTLYLPVAIDTRKAKEKLLAVLHMDKGNVGIFEYPGEDVPAKFGGSYVETAFEVSF